MARGFESKSVEFQQEEAQRVKSLNPALSPGEQARVARLGSLELARARAAGDLVRAIAPAHRAMLQLAIATLDQQIQELRSVP